MSLSYFSEALKNYGDAFSVCYDFFDQLCNRGSVTDKESSEAQDHIAHLDLNYTIFTSDLYDAIKDMVDCYNEQNLLFSQIKNILPPIVFDNELSDDCSQEAWIEQWAKYPNGYYVTELIKILSISMEWFDDKDSYPFNRFIDNYNKRHDAKKTSDSQQYSISTLKSLMNLEPEVCDYLFKELLKNNYIPADSNLRHFQYVFGGRVCPKGFKPLIWNPSKRALSELITLLLGKKSVPRPLQSLANNLFIWSKTNQPIGKLDNPKNGEWSNEYATLEDIVKAIKTPST